jgi:phage-related protein
MDILDTSESSFQSAPAFGASVSFSSLMDVTHMGDNHKKTVAKGINSLNMSASLSFETLTDSESQKIVSFLQSNFYNEAQSYSSDGTFSNKRITPFSYQLFFPYKVNKFYCTSFTHNKRYYNVNDVQATFICAHSTILDSVETYRGYNNGEYQGIDGLLSSSNIINKSSSTQSITFASHGNSIDLKSNVNLFPSGSYKNIEVVSDSNSSPININSNFSIPSSSKFIVPNTPLRNSIYINNPNDCSYYPYNPIIEGGTIESRMFDFRPSQSISIKHSPKYVESSASSIYKKYAKYGFNPNLTNLNLSFDRRTDLEAKRILLFLESHLGHKKFGFHLPEPYRNDPDGGATQSPNRRSFANFYCPEWTHTVNYKNNHSISAMFIECLNY